MSAGAQASADNVRPGVYEVVAETMMPHLEENLRYATSRERHCLTQRDLSSIFPILRSPSLSGCTLSEEGASGGVIRYRLVCENPQAAIGTARLNTTLDRIVGILEIKLGGKNMTMSQRIQATRQGACGAG
ncbi:MAG: DUF3617 domain-containing protein [Steroidobacter sp.]